MSNENTSDVQAETEIEQEEVISEEIPAFVTGFGDDEEVDILPEDDKSSEIEDDTPANEKEEVVESSDEEKKLETAPIKIVGDRVKELESHITDLNKALHEARQITKKHKEVAETPPLTKQQLQQMFKDHGDDPETMYNLVEYMTTQAAKKGTEDAVDATEISRRKAEHDKIVNSQWPDLSDSTSQLRTQANQVKDHLGIGDHPFGDYMAMGAIIVDQLPKITKEAYEKGKSEALKERTEEQRQKDVKQGKLTPTGKKMAATIDLGDNFKTTAKQMGLTSAQQKIYARLIKKSKR